LRQPNAESDHCSTDTAMANFWDLPKTVRETIYRTHLVQASSVKSAEFEEYCRCPDPDQDFAPKPLRLMPPLLEVSRRIEREGTFQNSKATLTLNDLADHGLASCICFGENVFRIKGRSDCLRWFDRLWPRHANQIQSIILANWARNWDWSGKMYSIWNFKKLRSLRMLRSLVVDIDEIKSLRSLLRTSRSRVIWHDSLTYGPQIHLQMLRIDGMGALRTLRGLQSVQFMDPESNGQQDPIPGGFLETVVKREITQPIDVQAYVRIMLFYLKSHSGLTSYSGTI
jgi:hypothetical protein